MPKADLQARLTYLVSQEGGVRAAARRSNIPYSTFRRILNDENKATKANRDKINRSFRRLAPAEVKRREKSGKGAGFALVDEKTARKLESSYRKQGLSVSVTARTDFKYSEMGGQKRNDTTYGRGSSVDEAKENMLNNFGKFGESYVDYMVSDIEDARYRVIPLR